MSFEGQQPVKVIGTLAGADLSASSNYGKFVKYSTTNTARVVVCSATTDVPCGILVGIPPTSDLDQPVEVVAIGQAKVVAGASINVGAPIATDASGRAQTAVATQYVMGFAGVDSNGRSAGDLMSAMICPQGIKA